MLSGVFPNNVSFEIDFTDEAVVLRDVPVVKILFQVMVILKLSQKKFHVNTYYTVSRLIFVCVSSQFSLDSLKIEAYKLRS